MAWKTYLNRDWQLRPPALRHVRVVFAVVLVARQVLALDERLDALLDGGGLRHEARRQLAGDLRDDGVVVQALPSLRSRGQQ